MIVFLDFDGVLRRESASPSCFQKDCLERLESTIRPFEDIEIVISSTWRIGFSLDEIRSMFSPDIAARIVDSTPELENVNRHERFQEIKKYLTEQERDDETWIAIDDSAELFPADAPLLLTESDEGFNETCAIELRLFLWKNR